MHNVMLENELTGKVFGSEGGSSIHSLNRIGRRRSRWVPRLKQRELPRRSTQPARERLKRKRTTIPFPLQSRCALCFFPLNPITSASAAATSSSSSISCSSLPPRRCRDYPSFSSTLLDAIYRSIDETDNRVATKEHRLGGAPDRNPVKKQNTTCFPDSRRTIPPVTNPAVTLPRRTATSSSSDGSSYGSFSSSDTESASTPHPARLRPIRTTPAVRSARFQPDDAPDQFISSRIDEKRAKKERHGSIRSCLRDLRNGRPPSSPGARLTNFITSLFAAKSKVSAELACSTETSYSRSCLSKTPSTAKRTVRFCPVSVIVGEDCRPCGEKLVYGGDGPVPAAPPPVRRSKVEEEDEEDDLFELKNLAVIGRFRDELPVYETTCLGKYSGPSRGIIL